MKKCLTALLLCAAPALAMAANGVGTDGYVGLSYVASSIQPNHATDHANTGAVQFNFGTWFNQQQTFGAEGRVGLGLGHGNVSYRDKGEREVSIDRYFGAYLRGEFPTGLPLRPYGLLGITRMATTEKDHAGSNHDSNYTDLSLGLGVDIDLTPKIYVDVEYLRVADHDGERIDNISFGVNGRF